MRKFILGKQSEIYEQKGMVTEAAKLQNAIASLELTYTDKIKAHMKEAELYIKAGELDQIEHVIKKALGFANEKQKIDMRAAMNDFCLKQAEAFERSNKRTSAIRLYEKVLTMDFSEKEKSDVRLKLLNLYEKTGRIKDYINLRNKLSKN